MTDNRLLYYALGVLTVVSIGAVSIGDDGVVFPDGSVQTTAAPPAAWSMTCALDSIQPTDSTSAIICRSNLSAPGGEFGDLEFDDGVPEGYVFLVTDVHLHARAKGVVELLLWVALPPAGGGDFHGQAAEFTLASDTPSHTFSFTSPLMIVPSGGGLQVEPGPSSAVIADIWATGYLTANPEVFTP